MNGSQKAEFCSYLLIFTVVVIQQVLIIDCCFSIDLPPMPHAFFNETRPTHTQYQLGETVIYKCVDGFQEVNGTNHAVCLHGPNNTLHWIPPTSTCVSEGCTRVPPERAKSQPADLEDGGVTAPPYPLGTKATYSCLYGYYKTSGTDTVHCIRDAHGKVTWSEATLNCAPVSCPYPDLVEHADRTGLLFTHPNAVTYTCHKGYYTRDESVLYCLPTGRWSSNKPPTCRAVECPVLDNPSNGVVTISERTFGAVAIYSCFSGNQLRGDSRRQCSSNATWTGTEPVCSAVHCKPITSLPYGSIPYGKGRTNVSDTVIMKCFKPVRTQTSKCLESGEWNPPPLVCEDPSTTSMTTTSTNTISTTTTSMPITYQGPIVPCDDPGGIENGGLEDSQGGQVHFPTTVSLNYSCNPGYWLDGPAILHCLSSGIWHQSRMPKCRKIVPVSVIVGVTVGLLFLVVLIVLGVLFYKKKRKAQEMAGVRRKANSIDARDIEEMRCLEKEKKPIPVTSL